jgi:hypothetical protein
MSGPGVSVSRVLLYWTVCGIENNSENNSENELENNLENKLCVPVTFLGHIPHSTTHRPVHIPHQNPNITNREQNRE